MAQTKVDQKALARALMDARTPTDVQKLIQMAKSVYGALGFRSVGDRENNIGTIRVASDPALGLVERVTNAMDALLDLGHFEHPADAPVTPREAAQLWYGVPRGGLADMDEKARRALGEKTQVWLDESGDTKRPTMVTEDRGIGQSPPNFPRTLVSLNESNKVGQPWTMGTYGQGGAVTYGFSVATIVISRRHPKYRGEAPDTVGWTIVEEHETDPALQILPSYKYLVGSDNEVLELDPSLFPGFEHGTRIIHVAYDLQGWTGPFTTGIWQFLHAALFDPVLPFLVTGKRAKEKTYGSRIVIGNAARLARPEKARGDLDVVHTDSTKFDLGSRYGSVVFNYWVLQRPADSTKTSDPAAGYVEARTAVSMTLFGQRQDTESRAWIKDNAMLPFLYKNMVVQIDSDALLPIAKREVFTTTRERGTKSELLNRIYEHLASVLRNDDKLKTLNHEEKERLLSKSTTVSNEKVRKRLAKFIKTKLKDLTKAGKGGVETGAEGKKKGTSGTKGHRDTDDKQLPNVPTKLLFKRESVRVNQSAGGYVWVEINAKNGYLPAHDDELKVMWDGNDPGDKVKLAMRSKLLGGLSRWYFEAEGDAPLDDYVCRASLLTANGVLSDKVAVTVAVAPPAKPKETGTEPETGPRVEWVNREQWPDHNGMGPLSVGYVSEDAEETIIWVNRHYTALDKALAARTLTPEAVDTRANRYLYPIAAALWLQHHELKTARPRPDDKYLEAEKQRLAEAVLVAIDPDVDVAMEESES
ncbi:MAG: hypothetical protein HY240_06885 [Actinobacteria bacterium]|nr:hypothetical protein [Actinomycetota bacterium]